MGTLEGAASRVIEHSETLEIATDLQQRALSLFLQILQPCKWPIWGM